MTPDKVQALASMNTRQKVVGIVFILVILFIIWQIFGMSGGGKTAPQASATSSQNAATKTMNTAGGGGAGSPVMGPTAPRPAEVPQATSASAAESEMAKLQQETQTEYLKAVNQLQILKVTRDIAQTSKDISTANLAKVQADKKVIDILAPPAPPTPAETLKTSVQIEPASGMSGALSSQEVKYNVISVSQLQYRWGAVLSYKGNLYNVHVGDVLPPDGSTVTGIAKDGVTLEKNGVKTKVSLVPII